MTERTRPLDALLNWVDRMPIEVQPYLRLARYDRPVGFWLLAIPCWIGLAVSRIGSGSQIESLDLAFIILYGMGAVAMRGAGCTYNDIVDKNIDSEVERTRARPIPSGQVSIGGAWAWLAVQLFAGLIVWLALPFAAKMVALLALPLVGAYPFMKRITWWPQAWLGLTFNFGVLIAATAAGNFGIDTVVLYLGLICWTIGYDTVYALQDVEDDALVGVKSTARLFGEKALTGITFFYGASVLLIAVAGWLAGGGNWASFTALAVAGHFLVQIGRLRNSKRKAALAVFRSNRSAGLIMFAGFAVAALIM